MSTYDIRLSAVESNYSVDKDFQRYRRELSRLQMDAQAQLKRCKKSGKNCGELESLLLFIEEKL